MKIQNWNRFLLSGLLVASAAWSAPSGLAQNSEPASSGEPTATMQPPVSADPDAKWIKLLEQAEKTFLCGDLVQADELLKQSLDAVPDERSRATVLNHTGVIQMKERRFKDAEKAFLKSLEIRRTVLGVDAPKTLETLSNYALATHKLHDEKLAENLYDECIALKRKVCPGTPSLANTLTNLAHLCGEQRRCNEAKKLYLEAIEIDSKALGPDNDEVAQDQFHLGALLHRCNLCVEALPYLTQSMLSYKKNGNKLGAIQSDHYISLCEMESKHYEAAQAAAEAALGLARELYGELHPATILHLINLADTFSYSGIGSHGGSGDTDKMRAERLYNVALTIAEHSSVPATEYTLAHCNLALAQFYKREHNNAESEKYFKQAIANYDRLSKKDQRAMYEVPLAYSHLLKDLNRSSESDQVAHRYLNVYAPGGTK